MPNKTKIEYVTHTSNPIHPVQGGWGCSKVSPGCDNCYAEGLNRRYGNKLPFTGTWEFQLDVNELVALAHLPSGSRVFICDMTDLFHPNVPFSMVHTIFVVMKALPQVTWLVLTKRPGRMLYFAQSLWAMFQESWPSNVWAGTSVESAKYLPRLRLLNQIDAEVRWVSAEPLLGPLDLTPWLNGTVNWVVAGYESGARARPGHPDWARRLRDDCEEYGVPFFWKQWGTFMPYDQMPTRLQYATGYQPIYVDQEGKRRTTNDTNSLTMPKEWAKLARIPKLNQGDPLLDGVEYHQFPDDPVPTTLL